MVFVLELPATHTALAVAGASGCVKFIFCGAPVTGAVHATDVLAGYNPVVPVPQFVPVPYKSNHDPLVAVVVTTVMSVTYNLNPAGGAA